MKSSRTKSNYSHEYFVFFDNNDDHDLESVGYSLGCICEHRTMKNKKEQSMGKLTRLFRSRAHQEEDEPST